MHRFLKSFLPVCVMTLSALALAHEPPSGLLVHLPLDGSVNDAAGYGYSGEFITRGGGPATGSPEFREGRIGQAIYLDGEHGLRVPLDIGPAAYPQVTLTGWVYAEPDAKLGGGAVFSNGKSVQLFLNGQQIALQVPGGTLRENYGIRPGRWVFVAATIDSESGEAKMQIDRRAQTMQIDTDRYTTPYRDVWFGTRDDAVHNNVIDVRLDDLRIYGRVLTLQELEGLALGKPKSEGPMPGPSVTGVRAPTATGINAGAATTAAGELEKARTGDDGQTGVTLGGSTSTLGSVGRVTTDADEIIAARQETSASGSDTTTSPDANDEVEAQVAPTTPSVLAVLQNTEFSLEPTGDVSECGGFGSIFNPLWKKNRDKIVEFAASRSCSMLMNTSGLFVTQIAAEPFQQSTPCDTKEQLEQRLQAAISADGVMNDKLKGLECTAGFLLSRIESACISGVQDPVKLVENIVTWYNTWLTSDGPASLGPRAIVKGSENTGTVLAPGNRRWFTPAVLESDTATVSIRRDGGNARVMASICTVNSMNEFELVRQVTFDSDSPSLSIDTLNGVDGHFVTVFLQTSGGPTNTGKRMAYSLEVGQ